MKQNNSKIKYFLYARKSSESEDRQVQSIDDQTARLRDLADNLKLDIIKIYTESKTAKTPYNRPVFDEMIAQLEKNKAEGILCWQLNRLSRNPIDSGKLSWLLQQGIIKSIQTIDRQYLPDDNVLLFNVESGMANQYILDLRRDTLRGMEKKLQDGWFTGVAPIGYLNDKESKTIVSDPERFNIVRKMWDLMLSGNYSPPKILEIANSEWGLTRKRFKNCGGSPLGRSTIYKIFTGLFYTGIIEFGGKRYQGKHEPMVTFDEFDRVQTLLGREGRPRPKTHHFAFTGLIKCAECGCYYTAETKKRHIKSTGEIREYTYYHCTRKRRDVKCTQTKCLREEELDKQIENELKKYEILPEFLNWALEIIKEKNDNEIEDRQKIYEMQHKSLVRTQKELDELTKMRYRQLIDDETFIHERDNLSSQVVKLKSYLRDTERRAENWLELTEKTFHFASYARTAFINGGLEQKKEILSSLGQHIMVREGKLEITPNEWLKPIVNDYPKLEKQLSRLELTTKSAVTGSNKAQKEALTSLRTQWLPG